MTLIKHHTNTMSGCKAEVTLVASVPVAFPAFPVCWAAGPGVSANLRAGCWDLGVLTKQIQDAQRNIQRKHEKQKKNIE